MNYVTEKAPDKISNALARYEPPTQRTIETLDPKTQGIINGLQNEIARLQADNDRQLVELVKLREDTRQKRSQAQAAVSTDRPSTQELMEQLRESVRLLKENPQPTEPPDLINVGEALSEIHKSIKFLAAEVAELKRKNPATAPALPALPEWNEYQWGTSLKMKWLEVWARVLSL